MGYALFCNRKVMLTARLNELQLQLDSISNQKQNLLNYQATIADGIITADERCNDISNYARYDAIESIWQSKQGYVDAGGQQVEGEWTGVISEAIGTASDEYLANNPNASEDQIAKAMATYEETIVASLRQDYVKNVETKRLAAIESQLDQMQKRIETKITATTQELQSVEQAEAQAIQNATPKYAGVG